MLTNQRGKERVSGLCTVIIMSLHYKHLLFFNRNKSDANAGAVCVCVCQAVVLTPFFQVVLNKVVNMCVFYI